MQQLSSLLSWHLLTAQHVSGVFPPIIRSWLVIHLNCTMKHGLTNLKLKRFIYSVEITNKTQPCNKIYYSTVHWRLNMFRAAYRPSSGALTVFAASGLHTHVVTGRSQVWVGTGLSIVPVVIPSNSVTRLHLVGCFYWTILHVSVPATVL